MSATMDLGITGKVNGAADVARLMSIAPGLYMRYLRAWLVDERARFLGGKDSKRQQRPGYRGALAAKRHAWRRGGTWSKRITNLFKGYVNGTALDNLQLRMGLGLGHPNKLTRALELMATGGTTSSNKYMPVPMYANLAKAGYTGPWHEGSAKTGLRSLAFKNLMAAGRLVMVPHGDTELFFDKDQARRRGSGYKRGSLLFMGVKGIKIRSQLAGRFDFYGRWATAAQTVQGRGEGVVDRATKAAMAGRTT
jgi:hypothetical protein